MKSVAFKKKINKKQFLKNVLNGAAVVFVSALFDVTGVKWFLPASFEGER